VLIGERITKIKKLIQEEQSLKVSELSKIFNVSEVTTRRDLAKLEKQGFIERTHGGAIVSGTLRLIGKFQIHAQEYKEQKQRIGKMAASLIKAGQVIVLDAGTTTLEIARNIRNIEHVTVITNNLSVALELAGKPDISVMVTGGSLRRPSLSLTGQRAAEFFHQLNVDITFLSVQGVSIEKGLTNTSFSDLYLKKAMISAAKEVILVADSSKFNRVEFCTVAPITAVHRIITDNNLHSELIKNLESLNIELIIV